MPNTHLPEPASPRSARRSRQRAAALAALALLAFGHAQAQSRFEEEFDDEEKPWQEIAIQLPPAPQARNLVTLPVTAVATQKFEIDTSSISLGEDGVMRYIMVATSESGARNVSYEGMRCATGEKKLYAFGQPDGSWSRSRRDKWEPIRALGANKQHAILARDYICDGTTVAGKPSEVADRLRYQRPFSGNLYR